MEVERIIKEGRTLRKSSKQIAKEVTEHIIEKTIEAYVYEKPEFSGLVNIREFRKFLTDASTKGQSILEAEK